MWAAEYRGRGQRGAYPLELRRLNDPNEIPRKRWTSTSFGFEISAK